MQKTIFLLLFSFCGTGILSAQIGFEVILVGSAPRSVLQAEELFPWFGVAYRSYVPEPETLEKIKSSSPGKKFLVFVGTWCTDTKRELPRFLKVTDGAGIPKEDIQLIFVDRNKKAKDNSTEENKIVNIPTFILLVDGKEKGRIVEETKQSMEKDLLDLLLSP
jgi:thiol-disulfide isomerase/thioredoxin